MHQRYQLSHSDAMIVIAAIQAELEKENKGRDRWRSWRQRLTRRRGHDSSRNGCGCFPVNDVISIEQPVSEGI